MPETPGYDIECIRHYQEHSAVLKQLTTDSEKNTTSLEEIKKEIQELREQNEIAFLEMKERFDEFGYVKIKNKDGRTVEYKRDEFDQWNYDRLMWKGGTKIGLGILGFIVTLLTIINLILQLLAGLNK